MKAIADAQVRRAQMLGLAFLLAAFVSLFLFLWRDLPLLVAAGFALAASVVIIGLVRVLGPAPSIWMAFPSRSTKLILILAGASSMWSHGLPRWWFLLALPLLVAWLDMVRP